MHPAKPIPVSNSSAYAEGGDKYMAPRDATFVAFLRSLLERTGLKESYMVQMLSPTSLRLYSRAFTHISIDAEQNYEFLEILGDVTCNKIIVWYIKNRFPILQNTAGVKVIARLRINLVSKKTFSRIAESLGFFTFISCDQDIRDQKMQSIMEDVLEAFIGATEMLLDSLVHPGAGYGICFNFFKNVFDSLPISLRYEDLYDPITRLKETFDYYRAPGRQCLLIWGAMMWENTKTDKGQTVFLYQVDKATHRKKLLSTADGTTLDEAKHLAAAKALQCLEKEGIKRPIPEYYRTLCLS